MRSCNVVALVVALVLAVPSVIVAQGQPAQFVQVTSVSVKLGMQGDFEDYVKKIGAALTKINSPQRLVANQLTLGGSPTTYFFSVPFEKWADEDLFDAIPLVLTKAYGDLEGARILKAGRSTVDSIQISVYRLLPNLSTKPRTFDPPMAHSVSVRTEIDPAMTSEYEYYLSRLKAAQEQSPEAPTAVRRVSVQGPTSVYLSSQPFGKYADRDAWPATDQLMRKAYGDDEAKRILDMAARAIKNRVTLVLTFRPDLSRLTVAALSSK